MSHAPNVTKAIKKKSPFTTGLMMYSPFSLMGFLSLLHLCTSVSQKGRGYYLKEIHLTKERGMKKDLRFWEEDVK